MALPEGSNFIVGEMFFDTETDQMYIWTGTDWVVVAGSSGAWTEWQAAPLVGPGVTPGEFTLSAGASGSGYSIVSEDEGSWKPVALATEEYVNALHERVLELERQQAQIAFAMGRIAGTCSELMKLTDTPGMHRLLRELQQISIDYYKLTMPRGKKSFNPDRFKGIIEEEE